MDLKHCGSKCLIIVVPNKAHLAKVPLSAAAHQPRPSKVLQFFHGSNERCQNLCQISRSRASGFEHQESGLLFKLLFFALDNIEVQRDFPTKL